MPSHFNSVAQPSPSGRSAMTAFIGAMNRAAVIECTVDEERPGSWGRFRPWDRWGDGRSNDSRRISATNAISLPTSR